MPMMRIAYITILLYLCKAYGDLPREEMVNPEGCGFNFKTQIVHGTNANLGEYPWVALIGYEGMNTSKMFYSCTGALINAHYVLTTAQCIFIKHEDEMTQLSHVRLGEYNIRSERDCLATTTHSCMFSSESVDIDIEATIPHPEFNKGGFQSNNIALIKLHETVDYKNTYWNINPICLPSANINPRVYFQERWAAVVGWDFGSGHPNDIMMRELLPRVNDSVCKRYYFGFDGEKQMCMKSERIRDRCTGDAGSPLSLGGPNGPPYLLVGLLSYGPFPCEGSNTPAVFTSVSYYRDWIDQNMNLYEE